SGMMPAEGQNRSRSRTADPNNQPGSNLGWGFSWPANRRIMYNRASARPDGQPWSDRKKWVWWDESQRRWVGNDIPDFSVTTAPDAPPIPGRIRFDAQSWTHPF